MWVSFVIFINKENREITYNIPILIFYAFISLNALFKPKFITQPTLYRLSLISEIADFHVITTGQFTLVISNVILRTDRLLASMLPLVFRERAMNIH